MSVSVSFYSSSSESSVVSSSSSSGRSSHGGRSYTKKNSEIDYDEIFENAILRDQEDIRNYIREKRENSATRPTPIRNDHDNENSICACGDCCFKVSSCCSPDCCVKLFISILTLGFCDD